MGASPHHTCGCSHIPLSIPGKIKRQNCTRASCSLQKKPPLPSVGDGVEGGEAGAQAFGLGRAGLSGSAGGEGIRPPGGDKIGRAHV